MTDAPTSLFTRAGDGTVTATGLGRGPWSDDALHGGAVAALLATELEAVAPDGPPLFPARLTLELFRPVGFAPHRVAVSTVRPGRRVRVLEAVLRAEGDDRPVARATLQQIERRAVALPADVATVNGPDPGPAPPEDIAAKALTRHPRADGAADELERYHADAIEHRTGADVLVTRGRALDWMRVRADLFPGRPLSPFGRVAAVADFGNGISSVLPFGDYLFVNPDLSVHLYRLPVDDWVCLDAVTRTDASAGAGSVGLAESALFDRHGRIGRALQSLVIAAG
jgi:hypothetical protein